MDIKLNWVIAVQQSLRTLDPSFTMGGVNIDIEDIGAYEGGRLMCFTVSVMM